MDTPGGLARDVALALSASNAALAKAEKK